MFFGNIFCFVLSFLNECSGRYPIYMGHRLGHLNSRVLPLLIGLFPGI